MLIFRSINKKKINIYCNQSFSVINQRAGLFEKKSLQTFKEHVEKCVCIFTVQEKEGK